MINKMPNAMVVTVILLSLLLHSKPAHASTYDVGDTKGWTFSVLGWGDNKTFKVGDTLVFKYDTALHNVVVVDKASYDLCKVPPNAATFRSGNDQLTLNSGFNYFICGIPGHCIAGMKIAATAI